MTRRRRSRGSSILVTLAVTLVVVALPLLLNILGEQVSEGTRDVFAWAAGVLATVATVATLYLDRRTARTRHASFERWNEAASAAVEGIEETLPPPTPKLEDEIAEVSGTLTDTVGRLREISIKAQAFEAEVQEMVKRADAAKATAELSEEAATRIGYLLGAQTEKRLREEIEKLTRTHTEQIGQLTKSGKRTAWITFVAGVALGTVGNIVVAALMG